MTTPAPPTDADVVQRAARAAARALAAEHGPQLEADVEAALHAREEGKAAAPEQYFDPISLGALIVSVASLAWTVYRDLRNEKQAPAPQVVTRRVRLKLPADDRVSKSDRDRIIDLVVEDITATAHG